MTKSEVRKLDKSEKRAQGMEMDVYEVSYSTDAGVPTGVQYWTKLKLDNYIANLHKQKQEQSAKYDGRIAEFEALKSEIEK